MHAILAPLDEEIKSLRTKLEVDTTIHLQPGTIWRGKLGPHDVCLVRTGLGEVAMRTAATYCFQTFKPVDALLIGYGGATLPTFHEGDLILSDAIVSSKGDQEWRPAPDVLESARTVCRVSDIAVHVGTIAIHEEILNSPHEKAFIGTKYGASVVAMEGMAFAEAAEALGIPWLSVRAIFDPMEQSLPEDFSPISASGKLNYLLLMQHLIHHPRTIARLAHFHFAAAKARENLEQFTRAWLGR